jgi:small-conductance mechanosensitive channel
MQVKFLSGGALVVEGLVLAIEPMRTVLRLADGSTLYISNSQVVGWMVQNDSQKA